MKNLPAQVYLNSLQEKHPMFTGDPLTRRMPCEGKSILISWKETPGGLLEKFSHQTVLLSSPLKPWQPFRKNILLDPASFNLPLLPAESILHPKTALRKDISKAIDCFKPGSVAGPDGLWPGHLKQLVGRKVGESGDRILGTIAGIVNIVLLGYVLSRN